jgi:5-methylcytosine-specific restriction endonuclease McrA
LSGVQAAWAARQTFWRTITEQVFRRYGRTCVHCRALATDIDHLTPIAVATIRSRTCGLVRAL